MGNSSSVFGFNGLLRASQPPYSPALRAVRRFFKPLENVFLRTDN